MRTTLTTAAVALLGSSLAHGAVIARDDAQHALDGKTFTESPEDVIKAASPAWHFDSKSVR